MDQFYQVMYGPVQDKLKYAGTVSLGLSIFASSGRADLGGYIGLLAILTVITSSYYLLKLIFILGPLGLIVALYHLFYEPKSWAWTLVVLLHVAVLAATIWFAWQSNEELSAQDGYDVPHDNGQANTGSQSTYPDAFQPYRPPARPQEGYVPEPYSASPAQADENAGRATSQGQQGRKEEGPKGENLL